ncbi:olfactory receptor 5AP2-like [Engystomops pustulosus]|uniref:olfactory receptor 5AP2-like n=1 Tax=Engystomops pustulosus TaxID=76066 RepID=UPI003AFA2D91
MENASKINTYLVLVGIVEMEHLRHLYATLALIIYIVTMIMCSMMVYTVWSEETLHEPMYIFIGNLVVNAMTSNSAVLLKLGIDLLFNFNTISLTGCLLQAFCIQSCASIEYFTFTVMAYDRYLAVCHPLRYPTLMTNGRAFQIIFVELVYVVASIGIAVALVARFSLCGMNINTIACETFTLLHLACGDTTVNNIFGTIMTLAMIVGCILVVIYCYIRTVLVCLKISAESRQKAIHTLVTHIVTFSTYLATTLFVIFRYLILRKIQPSEDGEFIQNKHKPSSPWNRGDGAPPASLRHVGHNNLHLHYDIVFYDCVCCVVRRDPS